MRHVSDALTRMECCRQGLGNVPIGDVGLPLPEPIDRFQPDDIVCHEALGGLLRHCERRTA